jgi:cob(I)alamin adenosyltransferase
VGLFLLHLSSATLGVRQARAAWRLAERVIVELVTAKHSQREIAA